MSDHHPAARLEHLIESPFAEDLIVAAAHGSLTEDLALAMLRRSDLPATAIEALNRNQLVLKHRKVLLQLIQHPHVLAMEILEEYGHPKAGRLRQSRAAARFSQTPPAIRRGAPALGEHTDQVLGEIGYSTAEIADLRAAGAFGAAKRS